ncbi:MAG: RIO1 family regulatory kinase/ATPase [Candidatus Paceibacterota bacterium]|jgi:serine/threonine protein kinase
MVKNNITLKIGNPESEKSKIVTNNLELFINKFEVIGDGGNATVNALENTQLSGICFKKIREVPFMKGNDLEEEFNTQLELFNKGVSVPEPILILKDEKGALYYFMERSGISIEDVSSGKKELPEGFELDIFFKDLENEVKKMHKAGFIHRDLRSGNVLINDKCKPVIIDFGTTIRTTDPDGAGMFAYQESIFTYDPIKKTYVNKEGYYLDDLKESIPSLKATIKSVYWRQKGLKQTDEFGNER